MKRKEELKKIIEDNNNLIKQIDEDVKKLDEKFIENHRKISLLL